MDYWRQLDVFNPEKVGSKPVTMIGVGGIGSPTVMALSKMGCSRITVYDDDIVSEHNVPNQFYRLVDVGKPKVVALARSAAAYAAVSLETKGKYVDQPLRGVVISGVDSMAQRSKIWEQVKYKPQIELYIEARMGAQVGRVLCVRPTDITGTAWYESTLYTDEQAEEAACTERAIIYNTFMIASFIADQVKRHLNGEPVHREVIFDFVSYTLLVS